jgi:hypothetical protein
LKGFVSVVVWITQQKKYKASYEILISRIHRLILKGGWKFTFLYLKEVQRCIISYLAGSPIGGTKTVPLIRMNKQGLPLIIPGDLREVLSNKTKNQLGIRCLLSVISIYRVFKVDVVPDFGSVEAPFKGVSRELNPDLISIALKELGISLKNLSQKSIKFNIMETGSPTAPKATLMSVYDVYAFWYHPSHIIKLVKYNVNLHRYLFVLYFIVVLILTLPWVVTTYIWGKFLYDKSGELPLGRLSIVYDQAGKARVIAICNYFIQISLKPLHDAIFTHLKKIEEDGTFNQEKPLLRLTSLDSNEKYYCFDLSSATDRLPIDFQKQILNFLSPNLGELWADLLAIEWIYKGNLKKNIPSGNYRYAVGQPMGAYSSWAMLALSHHVIVKIAACKVGIPNFIDYCILGDDIVIRNEKVADQYRVLMDVLGVSINMSKSIISSDFAEFAKRWIGREIDYTPIGPGLIIQAYRNKFYFSAMMAEALRIGIFKNFHNLVFYVQFYWKDLTLSKGVNVKSQLDQTNIACFGLSSLADMEVVDACKAITTCFPSNASEGIWQLHSLANGLTHLSKEQLQSQRRSCQGDIERSTRHLIGLYDLFPMSEFIYKFVTPGFWVYLIKLINQYNELLLAEVPVRVPSTRLAHIPLGGRVVKSDILEIIQLLLDFSKIPPIQKIEWKDKEAVRSHRNKLDKLSKLISKFS